MRRCSSDSTIRHRLRVLPRHPSSRAHPSTPGRRGPSALHAGGTRPAPGCGPGDGPEPLDVHAPSGLLPSPATPSVVRPIPEVNRLTYHALGQVGGLLNQMALCLNEGRPKPETVEVLKAIDVVARLLGSVRAEVLGTSFGDGRPS